MIYALTPGEQLAPADVQEGDLVQARDGAHWYDATVKKRVGSGQRAAVWVGYTSFPASHDARFTSRDAAIRVRLPPALLKAERESAKRSAWGSTVGLNADGTWAVECLRGSRKRGRVVEHLVRWAGWSSREGRMHPAWLSWMAHVDVVNKVLQHVFVPDDAAHLTRLIERHAELFDQVEEYVGLTRPKHHMQDHLARALRDFGPFRQVWCFPFEAFIQVSAHACCLQHLPLSFFLSSVFCLSSLLLARS